MAQTSKHVLSFLPTASKLSTGRKISTLTIASKCFEAEQELSKYVGDQPVKLLESLIRQCKKTPKHKEQLEICIEFGFATCYFAKTGRITLEDYHKYAGIYNDLCNNGHNKEESSSNKEESSRAKAIFNRSSSKLGKPAYSS